MTRSSTSSTARTPSSTRRRDRMRTSSPRRSTSAAPRRRAWAATTRGPHREVKPAVTTIPADARAPRGVPLVTFEGRWGELQKAFFNGPTGPNLKTQWTAPIEWSEDWRDSSYAVPTGGVFGTGATDLFCSGVARGSEALVRLAPEPRSNAPRAGAPARSDRLRRRQGDVDARRAVVHRAASQLEPGHVVLRALHAKRPTLFVGLGLLLIPIALVTTGIQWLLVTGLDALGNVTGDLAGLFAYTRLVGTTLTLLGLGLVQAATACALVELDAGRSVGPLGRTGSRSAASGRCSGRSRSSLLRGSSSPRPWSCCPSRSGWSSAGLSSLPSSSSSSDRGLPRSVAARARAGALAAGRLARGPQRVDRRARRWPSPSARC